MPSNVQRLPAVSDDAADRRVTLPQLAGLIAWLAVRGTQERAMLVALSGIDGSGKTHLAGELGERLERNGIATAVLGIDPWQTPKAYRVQPRDSGRAFYERAIRWLELFGQLVDPLVHLRAVDRVIEARRNDNDLTYPKHYRFANVKVVLLEGIFLLRRDLVPRYDLSVWVECGFDTALARALRRNQEGLPPDEIVREYRTIYFPAQQLHFERDRPREAADLILENEVRP